MIGFSFGPFGTGKTATILNHRARFVIPPPVTLIATAVIPSLRSGQALSEAKDRVADQGDSSLRSE
jgi:hypothetical protein